MIGNFICHRCGQAMSLTPREIQVLELMRDGMPNKEIALNLGITERTIKNHCTVVFSKLGVNSRTGAVVKALRQRIISLDGDNMERMV